MVLDVGKLTRAALEAVGKGKKAGGGGHQQNDVSYGRWVPPAAFAACLMDFGGLAVALPSASAKRSRLLPEVLMTARMLGAGSLFLIGQSSGS